MSHLDYYKYQTTARGVKGLREIETLALARSHVYRRVVLPRLPQNRASRIAEIASRTEIPDDGPRRERVARNRDAGAGKIARLPTGRATTVAAKSRQPYCGTCFPNGNTRRRPAA